ncbi:MAG: CDP-alcohol phosphatidyltransferase family protein [Candidatus Melainabacteria bacterium]|nr:CDP-alcohol phosphatidyltransferase family protein [Candidatus Melainabacteria bacterium]
MTYSERKKRLEETFKPREEWWSRVFATPVANAALHVVADWKFLTPNRLTMASFVLTIMTAGLIVYGAHIAAAILLQVAYILDCMDGQLARYRGVSSEFGSFLDKWSDFVKFPMIIIALTVASTEHVHSMSSTVTGFLALLFICYQPYLRFLAKSELSIETSKTLAGNDFFHRNMRFFLFEEAQWYLTVSLCLFVDSPLWALRILCLTQGIICCAETYRVFKSANSS